MATNSAALLLDHSEEIIVEFNEELNLRYFNRNARKAFDLDKPCAAGETFRTIFADTQALELEHNVREALQTGSRQELEYFCRSFNSWFKIRIEPFDGSVAMYMRDISVRKQAEVTKEKIFDLSIDMIGTAGMDGYFKTLNPSWSRTLGWSEEKLLSTPWIEFVHPEDVEKTIAAGDRLKRGKTLLNFQNRYLCADGSYKWISWCSNPDTEKQLIYAVARDVTEVRKSAEKIREKSEELDTILNSIPSMVFYKDTENRILRVNSAMAKAMDMTAGDLEGVSCYDLYPQDEAESFHRDDMRIVKGRKPVTDIIEPVTTPEGTLYFHTCKIPLMDSSGAVYGVLGIATDITKLKKAEEEKSLLNERLEFASSAGEIGVWDYDQHTGELVWNKTMFKLYGHAEELTTPTYDVWSRALHPEDRESAERFFSNALKNNERFHTEFRIITPAGETRHIHASALPMMDETGSLKGLVGINYEITRQKELEQSIRDLANTDPLTGVMNRRRFFELAEMEFERFRRYDSPLSCLIIDADHFKSINDRLGHESGDAVLMHLSQACESQLRANDVFCRFGGEEFVALLPETTLAQAETVAEKLRRQVAELNPEINSRTLQISISLGVSEASPEDETVSKMIERADNALYRAKAKGRNRVERG